MKSSPWLRPNGWGGMTEPCVVECRLDAIKRMNAEQLRKVQGYAGNQKAVEKAIGVRLRKLAKGAA